MKLLILNDLHLRSKNPKRRVDSYKFAILNKVEFFCHFANKNEMDYIICGGDVFDSPNISNILLDDFTDIIEKYKVQWLIVPGNHDIIGQRWENSASSSLAHLFRRSSYVNYLKTVEGDNCKIRGVPYYYGIEKDLMKSGLKKDSNKFGIAIVHAMITPKKINLPIRHISIDELKTDYDIVVVAHNHEQHGEIISGQTLYYFSGCMGRRKINERNIIPRAYIIDTIKCEVNILDYKQKDEVFDLKGYEKDKKYEDDIDNFVSTLKNTKIEGTNIKEIIEETCEEKKVKKLIFNKMKEYEEK